MRSLPILICSTPWVVVRGGHDARDGGGICALCRQLETVVVVWIEGVKLCLCDVEWSDEILCVVSMCAKGVYVLMRKIFWCIHNVYIFILEVI